MITDIGVPNLDDKSNRFFDGTPSADKLTELKNLIAEAKAIVEEGRQIFLLVETLIADLKTLLGK